MIGAATAAGMADRLDAATAVYTGDLTVPATAAAMAAKLDATAVAASVGGLSHMGRRGVKLSSRYQVESQGRRVVVGLRPPGAWTIKERGARAHTIDTSKRRRRGAVSVALKASAYPHPVFAVRHPGAKGHQAITKAFGRMRSTIPRVFHDAQVKQLGRVYG